MVLAPITSGGPQRRPADPAVREPSLLELLPLPLPLLAPRGAATAAGRPHLRPRRLLPPAGGWLGLDRGR